MKLSVNGEANGGRQTGAAFYRSSRPMPQASPQARSRHGTGRENSNRVAKGGELQDMNYRVDRSNNADPGVESRMLIDTYSRQFVR